MIYLGVYLFIAFAMYIMADHEYVFPWSKNKDLVVGQPIASFLWPFGLVYLSVFTILGFLKGK